MRNKSVSTSVLAGISLLFLVILGMGGIAYSFYRTEIAEEKEESADMANDDSPFEQLKKEQNMMVVPVPEENASSGGIDFEQEGIPTGTYSNPPSNITSTSDSYKSYSTEENRPIDDSNSSVYSNSSNSSRSLTNSLPNYSNSSSSNNLPNYSNPSSSNNFNRTDDNSLIEPLDDSDFLNVPSDDRDDLIETPSLGESPF